MKTIVIATALGSAFLTATNLAASASTFLTDGTFGGTIDKSTTSQSSFITPTGSVSSAIGSPAPSLNANFVYSASSTLSATVTFVDQSLSYDPAALGTISSIDASYDKEITYRGVPLPNVFFNEVFRLVIQQHGVDYVTNYTFCSNCDNGGTWLHLSLSDLVASDFVKIGGGAGNPNFSGDPIYFGVEAVSQIGHGGFGITPINSYFDNFDITVNQTPLPAALPLFATGFGGLGLLGWRRKWKNAAASPAAA